MSYKLTDVTLDLSATGRSGPIPVADQTSLRLELVVTTSDAIGSIKIQESVDGTNWEDCAAPNPAISDLASANTTRSIDIIPADAAMYAVYYTRTSGSGTMVVEGWSKGVGV